MLLVCCLATFIQLDDVSQLESIRQKIRDITYLVRAQDSVANQGAKSARLEMLLERKQFRIQ